MCLLDQSGTPFWGVLQCQKGENSRWRDSPVKRWRKDAHSFPPSRRHLKLEPTTHSVKHTVDNSGPREYEPHGRCYTAGVHGHGYVDGSGHICVYCGTVWGVDWRVTDVKINGAIYLGELYFHFIDIDGVCRYPMNVCRVSQPSLNTGWNFAGTVLIHKLQFSTQEHSLSGYLVLPSGLAPVYMCIVIPWMLPPV